VKDPRPPSPFDRFELDPSSDLAAITEALRERAEEARSDEERADIRAAWEALTLHPETRVELALTAFPETRAPIGRPPRAPVLTRPVGAGGAALALLDLLSPSPLGPVLDRTLGPETDEERALWAPCRAR
jgi:hypothetical protein